MSKNTTSTISTTSTFEYSAQTTCACCGNPAYGSMIPFANSRTNQRTRYMHEMCVCDHVQAFDDAAGASSGKPNNTGCQYRISFDCANDSVDIAAAFCGCRENRWYRCGDGLYVSPLWLNMKWQRFLEYAAAYVDKATVTVEISLYDGTPLETVVIKWGNRNERGQFLPKGRCKGGKLLREIDRVTSQVKGYRNYSQG